MRRTTLVSTLALLLMACGGEAVDREQARTENEIAKVRVYRDGRITVDGTAASLDDVQGTLARLKERDGVVWYYREDGESEPHANAMAVIQAIVEAGLPVSLSSQEDFSDVVLPDGTTVPR